MANTSPPQKARLARPCPLARTWLLRLRDADNTGNAAIMEPFVLAFALIGLAMAVLIVGNVDQRRGDRAVPADRRPQVPRPHPGPGGGGLPEPGRLAALAGCFIGAAGGYLLSVPVLHQSAGAYGVGSQQVPLWALVLAPAGMLAITLLAAFGPALRPDGCRPSRRSRPAARPPPAAGTRCTGWPRGSTCRARSASAWPRRSPGPRATLVTLAAIAFGATAVIFAVGLHSSLSNARDAQTLAATVPVIVQQNNPGIGPNQVPTAAQFAAAAAAISAQPGTAHANAEYRNWVTVVGITQDVNASAFDGPSSWMGYGAHLRSLVRRARPGRRQHHVPYRQRARRRRHRDRLHR